MSVFAAVVLVVMVAAAAAAGSPPLGAQRVSGPGFDGIVMVEDTSGAWTPTRQQITELERALPAYAATALKRWNTTLPAKLSEYKRQYTGWSDGTRRTIHVTFFHESTDSVRSGKWLEGPIRVAGGGASFLFAEYDPNAKAFISFLVNSSR